MFGVYRKVKYVLSEIPERRKFCLCLFYTGNVEWLSEVELHMTDRNNR